MSNTIYTPEVIAYADRVMEVLEDGLHPETKKNFFEAEFTTPDRGRRLFREILSDQATANFLEREDNAVQMTLEQMQGVMKESIIKGSLEELRENGLVDWIEDEDGEEVVFLTEKGKDFGATLFGNAVPETPIKHIDDNIDAIKQRYEADETQN
jgi:hypothetical protein